MTAFIEDISWFVCPALYLFWELPHHHCVLWKHLPTTWFLCVLACWLQVIGSEMGITSWANWIISLGIILRTEKECWHISSLGVVGGHILPGELGPVWASLLLWSTVKLTFVEEYRQEVEEQSWGCSSVVLVLPEVIQLPCPWLLQSTFFPH